MLYFVLALSLCGISLCSAKSATVFSAVTSNADVVSRKQQFDLQQLRDVQLVFLEEKEQRDFIASSCGEIAVAAWDKMDLSHLVSLKTELFKWCALSSSNPTDVVAFLDSSSPILSTHSLSLIIQSQGNVAIVDDSDHTNKIHGAYIQLQTKERSALPSKMMDLLIQNEVQILQKHGLLIPQALYQTMESDGGEWYYLWLQCHTSPAETTTQLHQCLPASGYCCSVQDRKWEKTIFLSRHLVLPNQNLPSELPSPFGGAANDGDKPFISTIAVKSFDVPDGTGKTPNFYQILKDKNGLPVADDCTKCLREKNGANCHTCKKHCGGFCKALCSTHVPSKHVAQEWTVTLSPYSKDPQRLIPKIVHQTWFEDLEASKYPNMSRMVESFKQSGWDYRFYSDASAEEFLSTHFPPAVLEAYRAIIPGAFKADLFRYCVLLIHGGVYADVDIQLESVLDMSIPPDVGFMVPVDEPGIPVGKQMCLWNGLIAASPGHPFLAKAIETVVNQVRNRFTSVDVDVTFCPDPELSVLHAYDTLFTAGPCLLGASLNRVMGRNGQQSHVPGEVPHLWTSPQRERSIEGTSFVVGITQDEHMHHRIPGRTVILHQNKWDMGAHRFTFLEQNLVIAATDLPDSNDLENKKETDGEGEEQEEHEHYSKTHAKTGIYGLHHLYTDDKQANEDIRIIVDASWYAQKEVATSVIKNKTV